LGAFVSALAIPAFTGCAAGSSPPPTIAPPSTATSSPPATITGAAAIGLARTFNAIIGQPNQAIYAFAARLGAGVTATGAALPPDVVALAATASAGYANAAARLQQQQWPPELQAPVILVVVAAQTFAADLQLLSGLAPAVLADWKVQFGMDGTKLNTAENGVRAVLGLAPLPAS
jgi:hypothetical protein